MNIDKPEIFKIANDMALKWFEIHSGQRMSLMRFFLLSAGFCTAGYFAAMQGGNLAAATVVALLLVCFAIIFKLLDRRTSQLIKLSEDFLKLSGAKLATELGVQEVNIPARSEQKDGVPSYRQTFNLIYWFVALLGLSGIVFAVLRFSS